MKSSSQDLNMYSENDICKSAAAASDEAYLYYSLFLWEKKKITIFTGRCMRATLKA